MGGASTETPIARLSERQRQCLTLISSGRTPKEVASELRLSVETVHAHLKAARRTLGVGSSRQAAAQLVQSMGNHAMVMADERLHSHHLRHEAASGPVLVADELHDVHPVKIEPAQAARRLITGRFDHLTPGRRALFILLALIGGVVTLSGLVATAHSLQQMLWQMYNSR